MKRTHAKGSRILRAKIELPQLRGNARPYFSVTGEEWDTSIDRREPQTCGCVHDLILAQWPDLADVVALHLSDDDGVPMHGVANGWYWIAGTFANGGWERYHGGSGRDGRTPEQCLQIFADHARVSLDVARALREELKVFHDEYKPSEMKAHCVAWLNAQRPRWKSEAEAVIAKYSLEVTHS